MPLTSNEGQTLVQAESLHGAVRGREGWPLDQWSSMWHTAGPGGGGRAGTTTSGDCTAPKAHTGGLVWGLQPEVIEIGAVGRATLQRLRRRCKGCERLSSVIEQGSHVSDPSFGNSPASREVLPARQEGASWGRRGVQARSPPPLAEAAWALPWPFSSRT